MTSRRVAASRALTPARSVHRASSTACPASSTSEAGHIQLHLPIRRRRAADRRSHHPVFAEAKREVAYDRPRDQVGGRIAPHLELVHRARRSCRCALGRAEVPGSALRDLGRGVGLKCAIRSSRPSAAAEGVSIAAARRTAAAPAHQRGRRLSSIRIFAPLRPDAAVDNLLSVWR